MMRTTRMLVWPLLAMLLASCVTINIYFPAAAAEEAAKTIVRDVLGKDAAQAEPGPQSAVPGSPLMLELADRVLMVLVPPAHASQANIDISSPGIRRLRGSMRARQPQLDPHYRSGAVGFNNQGLLSVRDAKAVALRDRSKVKKLVADENRDRNALYREIAQANGHPEWEKEIRATFARIWAQEARTGYWVQNAAGAWSTR